PIIFLNYTESIEYLKSKLPGDLRYRQLVGGMSRKMRDEQLADFQSNKVQMFITQLDAGSASIDLHDVHGGHPRVTFISPSYNADKLVQALGRTPRNGGKSDCLQYIVFVDDPVEKRAAQLVQAKLNNMALLNDGDLSGVVRLEK